MRRRLAVGGIVLDRGGHPAGGCDVRIRALDRSERDSGSAAATSAADGTFRAEIVTADCVGFLVVATDPTTGDASDDCWADGTDPAASAWATVRLRPTTLVRGRFIDAAGTPVAGGLGWLRSGSRRDGSNAVQVVSTVTELTADASGVFAARVPNAEWGSIVARGGSMRLGEPVAFVVSGVEVDAGDVRLPGGPFVEWTLRFVDEAGRPCSGVELAADARWSLAARSHESFDPEHWRLRADDRGVLTMRLSTSTQPLLAAAGGTAWRTEALALPLDASGRREAEVKLEPRVALRVRLTGPGAPSLVAAAPRITLGPIVAHEPELFIHFDVATGAPTPFAADDAISPAALMSRRSDAAPVGPDGAALLHADPGEVVSVECGIHDGDFVVRKRVELDDAVRSVDVDLEVPAGRAVRLDRTAVESSPHGWPLRWQAWIQENASDPPPVPPWETGEIELPGDETPVPSGRCVEVGLAVSDGQRLWAPDGVRWAYFGFLGSGGPLGRMRERGTAILAVRIPDGPAPVVRVPLPDGAFRESALLEVQVERGVARFEHAGLPVEILAELRRGRSHAVVSSARTDAGGVARFRVPAGAWRVRISAEAGAVETPWEACELAETDGKSTTRVRLELVFTK